jgi:hypothetical protein
MSSGVAQPEERALEELEVDKGGEEEEELMLVVLINMMNGSVRHGFSLSSFFFSLYFIVLYMVLLSIFFV